MEIASTKWSFRNEEILPIIKVVGECQQVEYEDILVLRALDYIEEGSKHKGVPCLGSPSGSTSKLSVSFSLLFPSIKEMNDYLAWVKQQI